MPAIPAIVGIASAGSSIYGAVKNAQDASKAAKGQTVTLPWDQLQKQQIGMGSQLGNWLQQYAGKFKPGEAYTGKIATQMTPTEKGSYSFLDQYLANQPGALSTNAEGVLADTLSGKNMDPNASPYIQAMRKLNLQNREDAINQSRLGQGYRNKFLSRSALAEEGDITERNLNNLDAIIGQFIQNERQNQIAAVPQALSADRYNQNIPLEKAAASQKYGSLARAIDEANMEAEYNQWARQRNELSDVNKMGYQFAFGGQPFGTTQAQIFPGTAASTGQSGNMGAGISGLFQTLLPLIQGLFKGGAGKSPGLQLDKVFF